MLLLLLWGFFFTAPEAVVLSVKNSSWTKPLTVILFLAG